MAIGTGVRLASGLVGVGLMGVGEVGWQATRLAITRIQIVLKKKFLGWKSVIAMIILELKNQGAACCALKKWSIVF
jgi:hypothetical protein